MHTQISQKSVLCDEFSRLFAISLQQNCKVSEVGSWVGRRVEKGTFVEVFFCVRNKSG